MQRSNSLESEFHQPMDLQERLNILRPLIKQASQIALAKFGHICGHNKADGTFVTQADQEVEACLIQGLQKHFPAENVVGEETGWHQAASDYIWSIDPIDGTSAYLCRLPTWGISIGLIKGNEPILGMVYLPVLNELYWGARGFGAYVESPLFGLQKLDIRNVDLSQKEHLLLVPSTFHHKYAANKYHGKVRSLGSTVIHALTVARGDASGAFMRIYHWDVAGVLPILFEAGGCVDTLEGTPFNIRDLTKDNPKLPTLILSNPQDREALLTKLVPLKN